MLSFLFCVVRANAQDSTFSNDLMIGSSGKDVVNLQTWLMSNGYDIPAISIHGGTKGYFGEQTRTALSTYQKSIGFPSRGFFGPMTRERLNKGVGYRDASFRVISPNGGEVWQKGTLHSIVWTSPYYFRSTIADLRLLPYQQPCTTQVCPMYAIAPYIIATSIPINQNSYNWNVGSVYGAVNMTNGLPGDYITIPDGQYTVQICESVSGNCDSSDAVFTLR